MPDPARGATATTWTGALGTDWNDAGNWTDGVPEAGDAFVGAGADVATSATAPDFHRLNLQNTTGLLTIGHPMTLQRLDDHHADLVGNGTSGNLRISNGGSLTLTGDSSADLFNLRGFSAVSSATVEGGSVTTTDPTKGFQVGGSSNQGTTFTLDSGSVNIAGDIGLGNGGSSRGTMNLDGGTFTFGGNFVVRGTTVGIIPKPAAVLNIDGATVLGTGTAKSFRVGSDTQAGDHGLVNLMSGSLELGTDATMRFGPSGSFFAPSSSGRFFISGGGFQAPGEGTFVEIATFGGSPTSTIFGIPTADHGGLNQSAGSALIEGELRIGHGPPTSTTGGVGIYVHRGGDMTVSNSSGTGLLRVAIKSDLMIAGGTITADQFQIDAGISASGGPGELNGRNGTLVGPVSVGGIISPGTEANSAQNNLPGTLDIHGDLTLASTAEAFFDFKDPTLAASTFDTIRNDEANAAAFDGTLRLRFFGGQYDPGTVTIFEDFASYGGAFDDVVVTGLTNGETATFDPTDGSVTIEAAAPPPPPPTISIADVSVTETDTGSTDAVFTVSLSEASADPVSVDYDTADATAAAGSDYTAASGTLTIPAGQMSGSITIAVLGDTIDEPDETFFVDLSEPVGATIDDGRGQGTIVDDDAPPVVEPPAYEFSWADPVMAPPQRNRVVAGRTAQVRFSLGADHGLDVLGNHTPKSQRYHCESGRVLRDTRRPTRPLGADGLSYDGASETYTYSWEVRRGWFHTCRMFILKLDDGSVHRARFQIQPDYQFAFVAPTQPRPDINEVLAGGRVPVLFELGGYWGPAIVGEGFPRSRRFDCATGQLRGRVVRIRPFGNEGIRYRPAQDDYVYGWQTNDGWADTCRRWIIVLTDGQRHTADFRFVGQP